MEAEDQTVVVAAFLSIEAVMDNRQFGAYILEIDSEITKHAEVSTLHAE